MPTVPGAGCFRKKSLISSHNHSEDYPAARQTVGKEIPVSREIQAAHETSPVPVAPPAPSRKWTYLGATIAVVVIVLLGVLFSNSYFATMTNNSPRTSGSGTNPSNQNLAELSNLYQQKEYYSGN